MKKLLAAALLLSICAALLTSASAATPALTNQAISVRTGPDARCAWLCDLPRSTSVSAIESEFGGGSDWVHVEFYNQGKLQRGYVEQWGLTIPGDIPYADYEFAGCYLYNEQTVYGSPDLTVVRGKVGRNEMVSYLTNEGGVDYIEFYDASSGARSRGWIPSECVCVLYSIAGFMTSASSVYASPSTSAKTVGKVGNGEIVSYLSTESSFACIQFYSASAGGHVIGYVPANLVDTYIY